MGRRKVDSENSATRTKILSAAEKLFAELGIYEVTLSMIHEAAGQRNESAVNYHFGDKDGIIRAILEKHEPGIQEETNRLMESFRSLRKLTLRDSVEAVVVPYANKLNDPDGGVAYLRIMDQLIRYRRFSEIDRRLEYFLSHDDTVSRNVRKLYSSPGGRQKFLLQAMFWFSLILHGLANYSYLRESASDQTDFPSQQVYVDYLIDIMVSMLEKPLSE